MRSADADIGRKLTGQPVVQGAVERGIAGKVDDHAGAAEAQSGQRVIGRHPFIEAQLLDEGRIAGRGQCLRRTPRCPHQPGQGNRRLGGRAGEQRHRLVQPVCGIAQMVIEQEGGDEQRLQHHLGGFVGLGPGRVGGAELILVISRRQLGPVRCHVDKA